MTRIRATKNEGEVAMHSTTKGRSVDSSFGLESSVKTGGPPLEMFLLHPNDGHRSVLSLSMMTISFRALFPPRGFPNALSQGECLNSEVNDFFFFFVRQQDSRITEEGEHLLPYSFSFIRIVQMNSLRFFFFFCLPSLLFFFFNH